MPRNDTIETIAHDAPNLDYVAKTLEFEGLDAREALFRDARDTLSGKMTFDEKARQIREEARLQQLTLPMNEARVLPKGNPLASSGILASTSRD